MPLSCAIVFHSPQPSQRPDHLLKLAPQALHENVVVDLAMVPFGAGQAWRQRKSAGLLGGFWGHLDDRDFKGGLSRAHDAFQPQFG